MNLFDISTSTLLPIVRNMGEGKMKNVQIDLGPTRDKTRLTQMLRLHFDAHLLSLSVCAGPDFSHEMMGYV